jgi:hypothetical protein
MKRNKKPVLSNSKYQDSLLNSLKTYSGFPPRRPGCFRRGRNFLQVTFTTLHADLVKSILIKVYLLFISFAPPKETKQRKEAFLYEFFDNEVKNRFQNFASLRAFAPVLKAFENYSTSQEFFTAWGLKIYSDFPPRKPGRFRRGRKRCRQASYCHCLKPLCFTTEFKIGRNFKTVASIILLV